MLEKCPTCAAEVMFATNTCPNCQLDRVKPDPVKLSEWRRRTDREQAKTELAKAREEASTRPNTPLRVGMLLCGGGWLVTRQAKQTDAFTGEFSGGVIPGLLMCVVGIVLVAFLFISPTLDPVVYWLLN